MIHLMLNDLRRPTGEVFRSCLHVQGLILHLDGLISLALARAAAKRQAVSDFPVREKGQANSLIVVFALVFVLQHLLYDPKLQSFRESV